METIYTRCAGFDVPKKTVRVCLLIRQEHGKPHKELRTYGTTTQELLDLLEWLLSQGCTHVALEGTGVSWKSISNLFEGHLEVLVVNAQHIKAVPRRKTDTKDAEWIADLLQHGLFKASFIPSAPQRELTRYRVRLSEERVYEALGIQKGEIDKRQAWQSYIGSNFNAQRRLADWHFERAQTWEDLLTAHEKWLRDFNYQHHLLTNSARMAVIRPPQSSVGSRECNRSRSTSTAPSRR